MVELLGTYTTENASQAREDAQRCIIAALADPGTFLLDPLLALKPVRFLEGSLVHDLLNVFVSEKLSNYVSFYQDHKEYVQSLGNETICCSITLTLIKDYVCVNFTLTASFSFLHSTVEPRFPEGGSTGVNRHVYNYFT